MNQMGFRLLLRYVSLALASCKTKTKNVDSSGDGFVDPGEECDSGVGENTCATLGHYHALGTLQCTPLCRFDRSDCGGRCGDDQIDGANWACQLGDGTETDRGSPVQVSGLGAPTSISLGTDYSCAVTGGRVRGWGQNTSGQLGDSTGVSYRTRPSNVSP